MRKKEKGMRKKKKGMRKEGSKNGMREKEGNERNIKRESE